MDQQYGLCSARFIWVPSVFNETRQSKMDSFTRPTVGAGCNESFSLPKCTHLEKLVWLSIRHKHAFTFQESESEGAPGLLRSRFGKHRYWILSVEASHKTPVTVKGQWNTLYLSMRQQRNVGHLNFSRTCLKSLLKDGNCRDAKAASGTGWKQKCILMSRTQLMSLLPSPLAKVTW